MLAVEVGAGQAEAVAGIVEAAGAFTPAETRDDLGGVPRVVYAHRRGGGTV